MKHLINDDFDGMWGDETPQPKQKSTATTREFKVIYGAETRAKVSAASLTANKNRTPEQRAKISAKISAAHKNRTPEQRAETSAKRSAIHKGKIVSAETRAKLSAAHKNRTPEQRAKIRAKTSAGLRAAYEAKTPEQRAKRNAKISAAKRGHTIKRPVMTPYGAYPSITAVAKAANRTGQTVKIWIKKYPKHYYYLPKDAS